MDPAAIKHFLIVLAMVSLIGAATALPPLRAARWTAPGFLVEVLGSEPKECLALPGDQAVARRIAIGRAAFRTPVLLGGQAARAGLSCEACHRSGRGNPGFLLPGLSDGPGTADVTSSFMSSHRGDRVFNPRRIPDLGAPKSRLKVDQATSGRSLERFIRGLVVEEFDGPEPSAVTLDGLATYVRAMDPGHCGPPVAVGVQRDFARVDEALHTAIALAADGDADTARLLIASARHTLGLIDERYPPQSSKVSETGLRRASMELGSIAGGLERDPVAGSGAIAAWLTRTESWRAPLRRAEPRSLYRLANLTLASHGAKSGK